MAPLTTREIVRAAKKKCSSKRKQVKKSDKLKCTVGRGQNVYHTGQKKGKNTSVQRTNKRVLWDVEFGFVQNVPDFSMKLKII